MSAALYKLCMSFAVLLSLFYSVSTAPTATKAGSSFVVNQIPSPKGTTSLSKHPGIAAYAKALRKHGASKNTVDRLSRLAYEHKLSIGPAMKGHGKSKANTSGVSDPISASPIYYDKEFICPLTIGNQQFVVDFDTGSSDLWVFGKGTKGLLSNQTVYIPGPTAKRLPNATFREIYGDNSRVSGIVYTDVASLGGIVVENQAIEVATSFQGDFKQEDGLVGLAFDSINQIVPKPQKTIFTNLISGNLLSSSVMSVDLRHQQPGCYTFGSVRTDQYTGPLTYTTVSDEQGVWAFSPSGYGVGPGDAVNDTSIDVEELFGIADTGTTLIIIEDRIAQIYYEHVPTARFEGSSLEAWVFNCDVTLPDFRIAIGDFMATIPGEYINYSPNPDGTSCFGGIQPTLGETPFAIYGDILLKSVFAVFDRGSEGEQPRLGFASKA